MNMMKGRDSFIVLKYNIRGGHSQRMVSSPSSCPLEWLFLTRHLASHLRHQTRLSDNGRQQVNMIFQQTNVTETDTVIAI